VVTIQAVKNKILGIIRDALNEETLHLARYVRVERRGNAYVLTFTHPCASHNNWDFVALELVKYYGKLQYTVATVGGSLVYSYEISGVNVSKAKPHLVFTSIKPFISSVGFAPRAHYYLRFRNGRIEVFKMLEEFDTVEEAASTLNNCLGGVRYG